MKKKAKTAKTLKQALKTGLPLDEHFEPTVHVPDFDDLKHDIDWNTNEIEKNAAFVENRLYGNATEQGILDRLSKLESDVSILMNNVEHHAAVGKKVTALEKQVAVTDRELGQLQNTVYIEHEAKVTKLFNGACSKSVHDYHEGFRNQLAALAAKVDGLLKWNPSTLDEAVKRQGNLNSSIRTAIKWHEKYPTPSSLREVLAKEVWDNIGKFTNSPTPPPAGEPSPANEGFCQCIDHPSQTRCGVPTPCKDHGPFPVLGSPAYKFEYTATLKQPVPPSPQPITGQEVSDILRAQLPEHPDPRLKYEVLFDFTAIAAAINKRMGVE